MTIDNNSYPQGRMKKTGNATYVTYVGNYKGLYVCVCLFIYMHFYFSFFLKNIAWFKTVI